MAGSTSGNHVPASEAVQVLVSSLADESPLVRDASASSLKDIASLNPVLVLECSYNASRGGRRRFGNMAGAFQAMSVAVGAINSSEVDSTFMLKLAKVATAEIISSKLLFSDMFFSELLKSGDDVVAYRQNLDLLFMEDIAKFSSEDACKLLPFYLQELNTDRHKAAAGLLVSIGSHLPDLMLEEVYLHLVGPTAALPAMVQILADYASADALQFTPRLKGVLSRILPLLGNVRDSQRPVFANAFRCWSQATKQYMTEFPSHSPLDGDVMSFLNSGFELLLKVWAASRDLKVRISSVEALGQMVGLVTRTQLKAALPKLVPTILELYRRDQDTSYLATCSLYNVLYSSLMSESGPPLLDFEDLTVILSTLLPVVCINEDKERSDFSVGLKTYNEVQRCFLTVGLVYPEDLFVFLMNKCRLKEESLTFGALCVLKHLVPRLLEAWHSKRSSLVEAVKSLLDEQSLSVQKALSELIVVMASHCYLVGPSGELFVEYLVHRCALSDQERIDQVTTKNINYKRSEVKIVAVTSSELRAICEKGLLLLTITIPEMEDILWPFLLKMLIPATYTCAVATVCRCISELLKHRSYNSDITLVSDCKARSDVPHPEELFSRMLVLLHDPLARDQLASQILNVLCHLAPLFPRNAYLFWQDEIPKMKAYVSDTEDLKQDPLCRETWDDMIIHFLAETLDVIQDVNWVTSLGNIFSRQYELYVSDDEHTALLHRCLGILLQKVDDKSYVRDKIDWMYKQASIANPTNRLGLAKAMGLVASSHLDTVLEKLKGILDNMGQSIFERFLSFFSDSFKSVESDDVHAALALMYGYAARYAPSTVIEARIDALVGTNMLSRLLHVRHPTAKQAVITAIDLLGRAVINAAEKGTPFPLKRRDQLLDYILTLMGREDNDGWNDYSLELLHTQALALNACTTLVSVEPRLTIETRNHVLKATLGFFALPSEPIDVINPLVSNLVDLLCAILLTSFSDHVVCVISGEDGRSRAEQLLHILRQLDKFMSSPVDHQRKRSCLAVCKLLTKFRMLCVSGYCSLGCLGSCSHGKHNDRTSLGNYSKLPTAYVLPSREALHLGDRVMIYLPRCADTDSEVRKISAEILDQIFSVSLSLPKPVNAFSVDVEASYSALSSLEDVIAMLRRDTSIDPSEVFNRIVSSICTLLTKDELLAALYGCTAAICDKIKQSAEGAIQAVVEFVTKRAGELNENDVSRTTQSLISAAAHVPDRQLRLETLGAICSLAESTSSKIVFNEVLAASGKDITTKDIYRLRGGWPMQDAFYAFAQHATLSAIFLDHVISTIKKTPIRTSNLERVDSGRNVEGQVENELLQAAILALTAFFRGGGKVGKKAVEQSYSYVLSELIIQLGSCHCLANAGQRDPLQALLTAFHAFCECVGDLEMGKILAREGEHNENEKWIGLIGDLADNISIKRPKEVEHIALILSKSLNRDHKYQREAAVAALSEFIPYSGSFGSVLEQMVETLCRHVSDELPTVRRLCLRGLVQIPAVQFAQYTPQVLGVILASLDDTDESVQLTAVSCLLKILESAPSEAVEPILLNLSTRLRNLQTCMNAKMRADAFSAFGSLNKYAIAPQREAFLEQVHGSIPRLVLHLHDDDQGVRQACRNTLKRVAALFEGEDLAVLFNLQSINSDERSDYEDFLRIFSKQVSQLLPSRMDTFMSSVVQTFDAPWSIIQANAIYLACSVLSLSDDHRMLSIYYSQVFGMLVTKINRSSDAIVRATCSSALGLLLKTNALPSWREVRLDRLESVRKGHASESPRK